MALSVLAPEALAELFERREVAIRVGFAFEGGDCAVEAVVAGGVPVSRRAPMTALAASSLRPGTG